MEAPRTDNAGTPEGPLLSKKMPLDPNSRAVKEALKEGVSEWLDEQFARLGKWTLGGLLAAVLAGAIYVALIGAGWKHP